MQRPGGQVESARVQQQETAPARGDGGEFGETDVVANGEGDPAIGRDVDQGQFVPGGQHVRFPEGDFARYVDVEQMQLSMRRQ